MHSVHSDLHSSIHKNQASMTNALEAHVRKVAVALHEHQKARLYKIPNDMRIVGNEVIHGGQTPADFMGFTISGRVILVECKMRKENSLQMGPRGLKPHQQIALNEAHRAGGIGVLAWMHGDLIAVIDAGQINTYRRGKKSIAWKDIPVQFKHPLDENPVRFFWPFLK